MGLDICPVPYSNGNRYDFDSTFLQTQFFFLSLLHRNIMLLPKIFLLTTAIFITSNTIPTLAECNYTSYWETDEGNCIDLTELSRFPTDLSISSQPVEVKNLEIVSNDFGIDIQGVVTNISTRSVSIAEVSYGILDSNDRILYKGSFVLSC